MDKLVYSIITQNILRICKERVDYIEEDLHGFADCEEEDCLIIVMMNCSILFDDFYAFRFLWDNWAPAIHIGYQVSLCKEQLALSFFEYLDTSGKLIEYGYTLEDNL